MLETTGRRAQEEKTSENTQWTFSALQIQHLLFRNSTVWFRIPQFLEIPIYCVKYYHIWHMMWFHVYKWAASFLLCVFLFDLSLDRPARVHWQVSYCDQATDHHQSSFLMSPLKKCLNCKREKKVQELVPTCAWVLGRWSLSLSPNVFLQFSSHYEIRGQEWIQDKRTQNGGGKKG